jgi:hypothetical protein
MAKRVKKEFQDSFVNIKMCRIELKHPSKKQLDLIELHRPEILENEPKKPSRKSDV